MIPKTVFIKYNHRVLSLDGNHDRPELAKLFAEVNDDLTKLRDMEALLSNCPLLHVTTCNTAEQRWIKQARAFLGESEPTA